MKENDSYLVEIVENLRVIDPLKIVVFGSRAKGTFTEESDIDLVVVLNSQEIAQNFNEKMEKKMLVRDCIREINKKVPIDLIVFTKAEFDILKKGKVSFVNEINKSGKVIYEKTDKKLA